MSEKLVKSKNANKFIKAGFMTVVYESDKLCVCNIANTVYAIFNYDETEYGHWGLMVNPQCIIPIATDNDLFYDLVLQHDEATKYQRSFFLNDRTFKVMKDLKEKTDRNGPTKDIDFQMEQELNARNKSR